MAEAEGTRAEQIVQVALALLEEGGPDAVTMRAIAERVGIRAPSLYKHFPDKGAVEVALVAEGFRDQGQAFSAATAAPGNPLANLAQAYRAWAKEHPHLYRLMTHKPIPRSQLPAGLEQAAALPVLEVAGGDVNRARAIWGFAHGLTSLELAGRFPQEADVSAAWSAGLAAFEARS